MRASSDSSVIGWLASCASLFSSPYNRSISGMSTTWLLARTWTAERNVRGNRQGAAQITNWLPRLLADDAVALQLPRIERIQAWLHHARHVVDIPEMDRLLLVARQLQGDGVVGQQAR